MTFCSDLAQPKDNTRESLARISQIPGTLKYLLEAEFWEQRSVQPSNTLGSSPKKQQQTVMAPGPLTHVLEGGGRDAPPFSKGQAEALKRWKNKRRGVSCLLNPDCSSAHLTYFP